MRLMCVLETVLVVQDDKGDDRHDDHKATDADTYTDRYSSP